MGGREAFPILESLFHTLKSSPVHEMSMSPILCWLSTVVGVIYYNIWLCIYTKLYSQARNVWRPIIVGLTMSF